MGKLVASAWVPAFQGLQKVGAAIALFLIYRQMRAHGPPEPNTKIFITKDFDYSIKK